MEETKPREPYLSQDEIVWDPGAQQWASKNHDGEFTARWSVTGHEWEPTFPRESSRVIDPSYG